jgi:RHS repeat-associated protein
LGGNVTYQYVWSPVYVDALILRDHYTSGSVDQRLWVQQDANFNVTALLDNSGNVVEKYAYDPFGVQTVYDASWNARSSSSYSFTIGFQGKLFDIVCGLIYSRGRWYSVTLGRPLQTDAIGFAGGTANLYQWEGNRPTSSLDPSGLDTWIGLIINGGDPATNKKVAELQEKIRKQELENRRK